MSGRHEGTWVEKKISITEEPREFWWKEQSWNDTLWTSSWFFNHPWQVWHLRVLGVMEWARLNVELAVGLYAWALIAEIPCPIKCLYYIWFWHLHILVQCCWIKLTFKTQKNLTIQFRASPFCCVYLSTTFYSLGTQQQISNLFSLT